MKLLVFKQTLVEGTTSGLQWTWSLGLGIESGIDSLHNCGAPQVQYTAEHTM